MSLGMGETLLILLVALLVYGGRLPEVAHALGKSLGELRRSLRETGDLVRQELRDADPTTTPVRRRLLEDVPEGAGGTLRAGEPAPDELALEDISQSEPAPADPDPPVAPQQP